LCDDAAAVERRFATVSRAWALKDASLAGVFPASSADGGKTGSMLASILRPFSNYLTFIKIALTFYIHITGRRHESFYIKEV
jgi:hypothetical protein